MLRTVGGYILCKRTKSSQSDISGLDWTWPVFFKTFQEVGNPGICNISKEYLVHFFFHTLGNKRHQQSDRIPVRFKRIGRQVTYICQIFTKKPSYPVSGIKLIFFIHLFLVLCMIQNGCLLLPAVHRSWSGRLTYGINVYVQDMCSTQGATVGRPDSPYTMK